MNLSFPADFVWGVCTSSYQLEGAVNEDGRGESIWDRFSHTPGNIKDGSTGDVACDHYHRYREDVQLMKDIGVGAYCFSVAWPRIIPGGTGAVNQAGLDFYSRLVDTLLEAGITPFLKLYHWDLPQVLEDQGGWANRATAEAFVTYAEVVARHLGDRVKYWMTHNEPWVVVFLGYHEGILAPGVRDLRIALQASHNLMLAHGLAVPVIRREVGEGVQVGICPNLTVAYPASDSATDRAATARYDGYFNRWFLDPLAGRGYPQDMWDYYGDAVPEVQSGDLDIIAAPLDFIGVNYYSGAKIADAPNNKPPQTQHVPDERLRRTSDREIYPEGLSQLLMRLHQDYDFPALYITENGSAWPDVVAEDGQVHDTGRVEFVKAHFEQASLALEAGVPLRGYFIWSLMDNFEWALGYTLRYGITYVDYDTQARILKDSGHWYKDFLAQRA